MHASVSVLGCQLLSFHTFMLRLHMTCKIFQVQLVQELYGVQIRVYMVHRLAVGARPTPRLLQYPIDSANELAILLCSCRIVNQQALRDRGRPVLRGARLLLCGVSAPCTRQGAMCFAASVACGDSMQPCSAAGGWSGSYKHNVREAGSTTGTARAMRTGNLHTQVTAATPYRT